MVDIIRDRLLIKVVKLTHLGGDCSILIFVENGEGLLKGGQLVSR